MWDRDPNSKEARDARSKWSECVTDFGKMISEEVQTNSRYKGIRK